jgi:N-acyl amino acid synthase of PEP-CTERM/exosortase system
MRLTPEPDELEWMHSNEAGCDRADSGFACRYSEYFDIVRADSPALLDQAFRLRYQVYCIEHPFEDAAEHSDQRERDEDDDRSVHTLLLHRPTGIFAGTARAILPKEVERRPLPIHRILASQDSGLTNRFPAHTTAEISRFAVSKEFRRRGTSAIGQMMPYITFGLMRGIVEVCREHGISHIGAVMKPPLIRILGRFGVHFEGLGSLVEFHGMRQPCVAAIADLVEHNRAQGTLLWQYAGSNPAGL